jgi:putative tricarboxylic transport membrane protein
MILYPIVIFTCIMGSYLGRSDMFDVGVMLTFGVIGYFMRKFDFSYVAFLIGFILVPEWERTLQQVVIISENNPTMFFERPVAMGLMVLTFFVVGKTFWNNIKAGRDCREPKAKSTPQTENN